jgi:hypothetical protein
MEILKLKTLEHSGQGKNATHKKVLTEFRKSEEQGVYYCRQRGWDVSITETLLKVTSNAVFGFRMSALIKR